MQAGKSERQGGGQEAAGQLGDGEADPEGSLDETLIPEFTIGSLPGARAGVREPHAPKMAAAKR